VAAQPRFRTPMRGRFVDRRRLFPPIRDARERPWIEIALIQADLAPCALFPLVGESWGEGQSVPLAAAALRSPLPALRATFSHKGRREQLFALF
jgi:hypothetical protein